MNLFQLFIAAMTITQLAFSAPVTGQVGSQELSHQVSVGMTDSSGQGFLARNSITPDSGETCESCRASADHWQMVTGMTFGEKKTRQEIKLEQPVVHVILFWMNGCPHCHKVIENVLPPLREKYGSKLDILMIELKSSEDFNQLQSVGEAYGFEKNTIGVPFMIVGTHVLIGDRQIPDELPGLIETYLAQGGVPFPDKAVLARYLPTAAPGQTGCTPSQPCDETPAATTVPVAAAATVTSTGKNQQFVPEISVAGVKHPPAPISNGFNLAIAIMAGMVIAILYSVYVFIKGGGEKEDKTAYQWVNKATFVLLVIGFLVAGYLSYVEIFEVTAVCGPVGDCNTVQASPYAKLFGLLPIGVLGMLGYIGMFAALLMRKSGKESIVEYANMGLFGMAVFGTFFSLYLTYLEPFVIHAVCAWCLTSAVVMTLIMVINARFAGLVFDDDGHDETDEDSETGIAEN